MWLDWAIYWTLGHFLKRLTTINFPKSPTFLGNILKGVKINHYSSEIIFGQLLLPFGDFFLVTLVSQLMLEGQRSKRPFLVNFERDKFLFHKKLKKLQKIDLFMAREFLLKLSKDVPVKDGYQPWVYRRHDDGVLYIFTAAVKLTAACRKWNGEL